MVPLPINDALTFEFWVFLESLSSSSIEEQLLLLYGTQDGSLSITLNSYITIARCQNQLRVPHGVPLQIWTHIAVVFSAGNEVSVLMNGVKIAAGRLNKDDCNIPAFAYLQLGRGEPVILYSTSDVAMSSCSLPLRRLHWYFTRNSRAARSNG
jgi:hypothetical protein